jgi:hypothetical protein
MGKGNNVIQLREELYIHRYRSVLRCRNTLYTNFAYQYPYPHEREYNPFYVEPAPAVVQEGATEEDAEDDDDDEDDVESTSER